ncbi:MAG TPA: protease HtpX [Elusimicrobia bacterium]|nr:MAG: zinc metalloprotease HtpX [Elusimicrobia bacterium GWA2_66_18]HAZ07788.1 protease HtpX [Elusimicrobiota bacterium]
MTWFKRVFLFMAVNLLVVATLSITLQFLGVRPYLSARGLDYGALMTFCLIWGMGGAFISLGLSRIVAKWSMGVQVIDPQEARGESMELLQTVHRLAQTAGLPVMPEVGIYESPELNAFATGPTKSRALVAVSTGLLGSMSRPELEGVLAHELTHVANGDMVTMTLIQGVVNAFVMFLARVIAFAVAQNMERDNRRMVQFAVTLALEIALSLLGMVVVAWFSRRREFRADAGGARLAGRGGMIAALEALQRRYEPLESQTAYASLKIAGKTGGFMALLSTHPPLEVRIAALKGA